MATQGQKGDGQNQKVKRVALPSGKTIEVVYFQHAGRKKRHTSDGPDLHICPTCDSGLVFPIHWTEIDRASWKVTLRCPNCEWLHTDTFTQEAVERFDEELDRGTDELVEDLKRLVYTNMEEQIDRFCTALSSDHILPEDF
ncbi:hypothetical protein LCGC14_2814310 [marine sediment metagenome]|uniref:Uncharacterized protein n=1 Tax=marine sediment metagenome TaxID=412755 RepID=A0A0F8YJ05_9ZZZZ